MSLEFITQVSGTSIVSLTTPQVFSADYDVYFVNAQWERVTTYPEVYLTDSSNNVLNHSTNDDEYDSALLVMKSNDSYADNQQANTYVGWRELGAYVDNVDEGYGMSMYVYNPFDSSSYTFVTAQSASMVSNVLWGGKAAGTFTKAIQCNGLHFGNSSGAACDYIIANIYGVK